jgi:hypothetical protein
MCSIMTIRPDTLCGKKKHMEKRHCLECGGELVLAFRPALKGWPQPGAGTQAKSNRTWRCSTCGHEFTAEQLRRGKLPDPAGNSSLAARRLFDLNEAITSGVRKSGKRPLMR